MTSVNSETERGEIVAVMRDVTVTFDGYQTRALSRVSLDVRRGEVFGVLGPKGAGKSTLLKILAGRLRPIEGSAKVFGRSARSARSRVGYLEGVSDSTRPRGFFERFFGGKKTSPQVASGNSRLTQAVVGNRDLLVLDEPFAMLSDGEKAEAKALVRELAGRGKTVIVSSGSLMELKEICGRMAVLHEGRIQAVGTLPELLAIGGAIRFLPAVLPREMVERVLNVLRGEILESRKTETQQGKAVAPSDANQNPGSLENPVNAKPSGTGDSIDHEKLEGLTKPGKPG